MLTSRNTSLMGVLTIIVAVSSAALAYMQGQPISIETTIAAITSGIGLLLAKDHNK